MGPSLVTPSLSVTFAGHATLLLELDGVRLLTDLLPRVIDRGTSAVVPKGVGRLARRHGSRPVSPPAFNARWSEWPPAFERRAAHLTPDVEVRTLPPGGETP